MTCRPDVFLVLYKGVDISRAFNRSMNKCLSLLQCHDRNLVRGTASAEHLTCYLLALRGCTLILNYYEEALSQCSRMTSYFVRRNPVVRYHRLSLKVYFVRTNLERILFSKYVVTGFSFILMSHKTLATPSRLVCLVKFSYKIFCIVHLPTVSFTYRVPCSPAHSLNSVKMGLMKYGYNTAANHEQILYFVFDAI
ncbi:hypothetical protein T440DRAFT_133678 [Plenodomus tracheiphilus IPT5]|uniref:Uncharacterized protein n=1 Tax=Plenodomus tracheiphilus IPT5 TaxID=1408161 RepID=A0A6A7B4L1_9PLEO|nr:hypothetical protein T440DRAFT_133678 [Plenodomus tracheiphilus IPT5]